MNRERWPFATQDLFDPGTATLNYGGAVHIEQHGEYSQREQEFG